MNELVKPKREKRRVAEHNMTAVTRNRPRGLSTLQWGVLLGLYHFRCAYCGRPYESLDHIIPMSKGGGTTVNNVAPCCLECNNQKAGSVWVPGQVGTPDAIAAVLTDGEHVHDRRCISPLDLGWMNKAAQMESEGELWWELENPHELNDCCQVMMGVRS